MKSNMYLDTFGIFTAEVTKFEDEIGINEKIGTHLDSIQRDWRYILEAISGIKSHDNIYLSDEKALLRAVTGDDIYKVNQGLSDTQKLTEIVDAIELKFRNSIGKASRLFNKGGIEKFLNIERKILNLNKSLWDVRDLFEARFYIFPDSPVCRELIPSDPSVLKIDTARIEAELNLVDVLLQGAYTCSAHQYDLFDPNLVVDVILRVDHEIPELKTTMRLIDAQQIWRGTVKISCKVRIINNKLAEIIGDFEISNNDD